MILFLLLLGCESRETYVPQPLGGDTGWDRPDRSDGAGGEEGGSGEGGSGEGGGDGGEGRSGDCSEDAGGSVSMTFTNDSEGTVNVSWVDHACTDRLYLTLEPGQGSPMGTFVGHVWVATKVGSGSFVDELRVEADVTVWSIQ